MTAIVIFILTKHKENRRAEERKARLKEKEEALIELLRKKKNDNVN